MRPHTNDDVQPGDLVLKIVVPYEEGIVAVPGWRYGLVVAVIYPRTVHMGCEERIDVLWSDPVGVERTCDCGFVADIFRVDLPGTKK